MLNIAQGTWNFSQSKMKESKVTNQSILSDKAGSRIANSCSCGTPRRRFLAGLLAAGAGTILPGCSTPASSSGVSRNLIDTHHHFWSPTQISAAEKVGEATPISRNWSVARTLDDMDKAGVATSILSSTTYIGSLRNADASAAARESNEWASRLAKDNPGRFGLFAALPMQDTDGALREIEYALDVLKADGIGLHTNYGNKWLGHPSFAPVMDELNRRKAILYTHPKSASCCVNLQPGIPDTVVEFGTDTTRTIVDIVFSGTAARCPDLRFIFSHAGGTLPFLTERLVMAPVLDPKLAARVPRGVLFELKRFYYDTAWSMHPTALASLTRLVDASQILFGSDYPYRTGLDTVKGVKNYGLPAADLLAIERGNALRLMRRLG
jgi:predicted TIM-barrel fold metal-dependent hydrolase